MGRELDSFKAGTGSGLLWTR